MRWLVRPDMLIDEKQTIGLFRPFPWILTLLGGWLVGPLRSVRARDGPAKRREKASDILEIRLHSRYARLADILNERFLGKAPSFNNVGDSMR